MTTTNLTIFKDKNAVASSSPRELSDLAKTLSSGGMTNRRIQANTNGTFKRIVNGEQVGNAVRGEIDVIVVHALPKVSRVFYKDKFDPNKEATLPDCWSNAGDVPEAAARNKQHSNCAECSQNVKGSGENGSRACRFQRRIAVLLAGDPSGEVYQFNIPAKSLFAKGSGNTHGYVDYKKFLDANSALMDNVVTTISFNSNADTMELQFSPKRLTTDDEYLMVREAQKRPETRSYIMLTVAQTDGVRKQPPAVEVAEVIEAKEPVKRQAKKQETAPAPKKDIADVVSAWGDDD